MVGGITGVVVAIIFALIVMGVRAQSPRSEAPGTFTLEYFSAMKWVALVVGLFFGIGIPILLLVIPYNPKEPYGPWIGAGMGIAFVSLAAVLYYEGSTGRWFVTQDGIEQTSLFVGSSNVRWANVKKASWDLSGAITVQDSQGGYISVSNTMVVGLPELLLAIEKHVPAEKRADLQHFIDNLHAGGK